MVYWYKVMGNLEDVGVYKNEVMQMSDRFGLLDD